MINWMRWRRPPPDSFAEALRRCMEAQGLSITELCVALLVLLGDAKLAGSIFSTYDQSFCPVPLPLTAESLELLIQSLLKLAPGVALPFAALPGRGKPVEDYTAVFVELLVRCFPDVAEAQKDLALGVLRQDWN
jgi:hypothetical protein